MKELALKEDFGIAGIGIARKKNSMTLMPAKSYGEMIQEKLIVYPSFSRVIEKLKNRQTALIENKSTLNYRIRKYFTNV